MLDRLVGNEDLHPQCFIVCAGNLATDRAIVNQLSTAMQSRLSHYELMCSHADFMNHALKNNWDYRMLGFLEFKPEALHNFDPNHQDKTFPCPRTWEFVHRKIKDKDFPQITLAGLAANIGDGPAVELHTFIKEFANLHRYGQIIADPERISVPYESSTRYALIAMMINHYTDQTFKAAVKYAARFPPEFQAIYYRAVQKKDPKMRQDRDFITKLNELVRYIADPTY